MFQNTHGGLAGGPEVWIGDGDDAIIFVRIVATRGVVSTDEWVGGVPDVSFASYCLVDGGIRRILLVLSELAIEHHEVAYGNGARVGNPLTVNTIYAVGVEVLGGVGAFDLLDIEGRVAVSGDIVCVAGINLFDIAHDIVFGASCGARCQFGADLTCLKHVDGIGRDIPLFCLLGDGDGSCESSCGEEEGQEYEVDFFHLSCLNLAAKVRKKNDVCKKSHYYVIGKNLLLARRAREI